MADEIQIRLAPSDVKDLATLVTETEKLTHFLFRRLAEAKAKGQREIILTYKHDELMKVALMLHQLMIATKQINSN